MLYNGVGWVDKPNVSDGLWACWVFNPTYPLCRFFLHSTIAVSRSLVSDIFHSLDACSANKCRIQESDLRTAVFVVGIEFLSGNGMDVFGREPAAFALFLLFDDALFEGLMVFRL